VGLIRRAWHAVNRVIPMTRGAFVAFAILTLVNVSGFVQVQRLQENAEAEQKRSDLKTCESGNQTRTALLNLFKELRPASEIRRPAETDEQYTFRLNQAAAGYALLEQRLVPRDCKKVVNG